jgi:hypothetical protein
MLPHFSFDTIAEVSVALAGFSGLAAAFRTRRMRDWAEWERVWFWYILSWSFGSLLFSLLPSVLGGLGLAPSVVWSLSSLMLALFILASVGFGARRGRQLHRLGAFHPRWGTTAIALVPALSTAVLLVCSVTGIALSPSGAYQLGLFVTLALACGSFFLFIQYPLSE